MNPSTEKYFLTFPPATQKLLHQVRATILKAAPGAVEAMKYGIPTLILTGKNLVHYAAFEKHIGFYPTPTALEEFKEELSKFKSSKGAVQFPLDKAMPVVLISKMVKFRVGEISEKAGKKKPAADPFSSLPAHLKRALVAAGITDLVMLSKHTQQEILSLPGMGTSSMPALKKSLTSQKLEFLKSR